MLMLLVNIRPLQGLSCSLNSLYLETEQLVCVLVRPVTRGDASRCTAPSTNQDARTGSSQNIKGRALSEPGGTR